MNEDNKRSEIQIDILYFNKKETWMYYERFRTTHIQHPYRGCEGKRSAQRRDDLGDTEGDGRAVWSNGSFHQPSYK